MNKANQPPRGVQSGVGIAATLQSGAARSTGHGIERMLWEVPIKSQGTLWRMMNNVRTGYNLARNIFVSSSFTNAVVGIRNQSSAATSAPPRHLQVRRPFLI